MVQWYMRDWIWSCVTEFGHAWLNLVTRDWIWSRVSAENNLRPPFLARKRPDFGPISLLRWPVCVSNGAVVHVDGQQSKKMHGQQNSEALNQVQQSRVSSENPTSLNFFHLLKIFLGQKKAPVTRGLLAKRRSLSTFWPPMAHWVVGVSGAAVDVQNPTPFIYESTSICQSMSINVSEISVQHKYNIGPII